MKDPHSHVLFGVDDGAQTCEESVAMLKAAKEAGVTAIVATPHIREMDAPWDLIKERYALVRQDAAALGIELTLGAEVHWRILSGLSPEEAGKYCFEGTRTLLMEFGMHTRPMDEHRKLYELQREGLEIIIAHPERYQYVQKDIRIALDWQAMGCTLQIDALELLGGPLRPSRRCAEKLMRQGFSGIFGSDAHSAADYKQFGRIAKRLSRG